MRCPPPCLAGVCCPGKYKISLCPDQISRIYYSKFFYGRGMLRIMFFTNDVRLLISCYDISRNVQVLLVREKKSSSGAPNSAQDDEAGYYSLPGSTAGTGSTSILENASRYWRENIACAGSDSQKPAPAPGDFTLLSPPSLFSLRPSIAGLHIFTDCPPQITVRMGEVLCQTLWVPAHKLPINLETGIRRAVKNMRILFSHNRVRGFRL